VNRRFHSLIAAVLALVVIVTLVGCSDTATPTAAPAAPTKAATTAATTKAVTTTVAAAPTAVPTSIQFGFIGPITGPAASSGLVFERFLKLGADAVNAKGGITVGGKSYLLQEVTFDSMMTSEGSIAAANKAILDNKIKFIANAGTGPTTAAFQQTSETNKVLLFTIGGAANLWGPNFPYTIGGLYPNQATLTAPGYAQLAKDYPNAKKVAVLYDDVLTGQAFVIMAQAAAAQYGQTVVDTELYPYATTKDFGPLVTKMLAAKPDAIDVGPAATLGALGPIVKALTEQGFKGPIFGHSGDTNAIKAAGIDGFWYTGIADPASPNLSDAEKAVLAKYISTYDATSLNAAMMGGYDFANILAQSMVAAGTVDDTTKIITTMRAGTWDTMWGKEAFGGAKTYGVPAYLNMSLHVSKITGGVATTFAGISVSVP
jgi:branched-chain amino acid transport system substrate-binding protein